MLLFEHSVFLHVPKTGGTWVRTAARAAGLPFEEYRVDDDIHADLSYCPRPDAFKFAFVRHPCDLYASYWRFKIREGWDPRNPFDLDCGSEQFDRFVRNVIEKEPAWCSRMFADYVGPRERAIEFIGRFEHLADDLVLALTSAGELFDEARLRGTPAVNTSRGMTAGSDWSLELIDAVASSERDAFERFGYSASDMWWGR
jgi:hypothetical protein